MLTLSLLRHAKSSWDNPGLPDIDRPLNARGREAAPRMGALMRHEGLRPDLVLCSPSARTRQTLDRAAREHPALGPADYQERLYHATPATLLLVIREVAGAPRHILIVGHNPGLHELAMLLVGSGAPSKRRALEEKYPTGALAVITFAVARWTEITSGAGRLRLFVGPRDTLD